MNESESNTPIPFENRPQLKVFGFMNSGRPFALKPKGGFGESITFTLHMWIPAIGCVLFSFAFVYMAYHVYHTNNPPNTYNDIVLVFLWIAGFLFFCSFFLLSRWRSVRIFPDGSVEFNHPLFFIRKQKPYETGTVWLDIARKVPDSTSRKDIKSEKKNLKKQRLLNKNSGLKKALEENRWKPILVVHDGIKCFVLALNKKGVIEEYKQYLNDEYNLHPSGTEYIVRYGGITESGRV